MAIFESELFGDFDVILRTIENDILHGSLSASKEGSSDYADLGVRLAVRVYERYSVLGSNRLSMNLTFIQNNGSLFISVITSGGSQGLFFKINTFGEESFLNVILPTLQSFQSPKTSH